VAHDAVQLAEDLRLQSAVDCTHAAHFAVEMEPLLGVFCFFVTFFLIGIWHGRTSEFIMFGFLTGSGMSINKLWQLGLIRAKGRKGYRALAMNPAYVSFGRGLNYAWFSFTLFWFWSDWAQIGRIYQHCPRSNGLGVWSDGVRCGEPWFWHLGNGCEPRCYRSNRRRGRCSPVAMPESYTRPQLALTRLCRIDLAQSAGPRHRVQGVLEASVYSCINSTSIPTSVINQAMCLISKATAGTGPLNKHGTLLGQMLDGRIDVGHRIAHVIGTAPF